MRRMNLRRFSREEYWRMAEAGIFSPDERVELVDGEILRKVTPQGIRHARGIRAVNEALRAAFPSGYDVRAQLPMVLDPYSEPEPDLSVVRGSWRDYQEHPTTAVLVVEIADSTIRTDRLLKARVYARAGIPEYWILNLQDRVLEVCRGPEQVGTEWRYHTFEHLGPDGSVAPLEAPASIVRVADLLE
jgi:Uma2 family endonuclease